MRPDLREAKAAIDWAMAQLPVLAKRAIKWRQNKPYTIRIDRKSKPGEKIYRITKIKPIDPLISAEAGAIIHSIRSSLDILACALAARNGHADSSTTYFPIWKSEADFLAPAGRRTNPTLEKIKRLSAVHQRAIKELKPYPGGNSLLCTLHNLDLTRKHRRLLATRAFPGGMSFNPGLPNRGIEIGDWRRFNEKTVLVATASDVPDTKVSIGLYIAFDETGIPDRQDFAETIRQLGTMASNVLTIFCRPGM